MSRPPRRAAMVSVLLCCAAALSLGPGSVGGVGARSATAAATEYEVAQETLDDLADVQPGDRVHVVIQSKVDDPNARLGGAQDGRIPSICPAPFSGDPAQQSEIGNKCVVASGFIPPELTPDENGRIEFTVTIPPEGGNIFEQANPAFSCEPTRSCSIFFEFQYTTPDSVVRKIADVTSLAFTVKEPPSAAGCGAPQEGKFVDALGPSRLARSEVEWARQRCQGRNPLDLDYTVQDEVTARDGFRNGTGDVFFGAGGVITGEDPAAAGRRKSVPVPVALNAQVLAVIGGYPLVPPLGRPTELDDIKLTAEQFADVLIHPSSAFNSGSAGDAPGRFAAEVIAANPQLASMVDPVRSGFQVTIVGHATPSVGSWIATRYLADNTSAWRYPETDSRTGIRFERANEPIGELWELSSLNPGNFEDQQTLVADRPALGVTVDKQFLDAFCASFGMCVNFVFTDLATAEELHLPVVKVQNRAGRFVAPTAKSLQAAADDMTALSDGSLVPDLSKSDPDAYPFTFVEYANAAMEVGDACKAQTMRDVLSHLTDGEKGQKQLAAGLAPLTAPLSARAAEAVKKVGPQAPCDPGSSGGDDEGGSGGGLGALDGSALPVANSGSSSSAGAAGDHPTRPVTAAGQQRALQAANNTTIPLFAGMAALVLLVPLSALALTNGLTSGTAFGSAGRRLPPRVARALAAVGASLRRAALLLVRR